MNLLLASALDYAWALDIAFFLALIIGAIVGAKIGFVKGVLNIAGWLLSILLPFMFCTMLANSLESWFGLTSILAESVGNVKIAQWLTIGISFIGLFIVIKLLTWLLGKLGTSLVDALKPIKVLNHIFGSVLALCETFLILMAILIICSWLPIEGLHDFIEHSYVVSLIYHSDLMTLLPAMIEGGTTGSMPMIVF